MRVEPGRRWRPVPKGGSNEGAGRRRGADGLPSGFPGSVSHRDHRYVCFARLNGRSVVGHLRRHVGGIALCWARRWTHRRPSPPQEHVARGRRRHRKDDDGATDVPVAAHHTNHRWESRSATLSRRSSSSVADPRQDVWAVAQPWPGSGAEDLRTHNAENSREVLGDVEQVFTAKVGQGAPAQHSRVATIRKPPASVSDEKGRAVLYDRRLLGFQQFITGRIAGAGARRCAETQPSRRVVAGSGRSCNGPRHRAPGRTPPSVPLVRDLGAGQRIRSDLIRTTSGRGRT